MNLHAALDSHIGHSTDPTIQLILDWGNSPDCNQGPQFHLTLKPDGCLVWCETSSHNIWMHDHSLSTNHQRNRTFIQHFLGNAQRWAQREQQ